jgi:hypothetical protein
LSQTESSCWIDAETIHWNYLDDNVYEMTDSVSIFSYRQWSESHIFVPKWNDFIMINYHQMVRHVVLSLIKTTNCRTWNNWILSASMSVIDETEILRIRIQELIVTHTFEYLKNPTKLLSIFFESNWQLTRIKSEIFPGSSLGSAFTSMRLVWIVIKSENEAFVMENDFLIDVVNHKLIRNLLSSFSILIPSKVEIFFSWCESPSSFSFESNSRLSRIRSKGFSGSRIYWMEIQQLYAINQNHWNELKFRHLVKFLLWS